MTQINRKVLIFGALAAFGLVIAVFAISSTSASPRPFIQSRYSCDRDPTEHETATCTSNDSPDTVADDIDTDTSAVDRGTDDGMEFLQYEDDIVGVAADGSGSKLTVEDYETGYHHYSSHFVFFGWTSYRPSGGGFGGGGFGGGGYGGGGK